MFIEIEPVTQEAQTQVRVGVQHHQKLLHHVLKTKIRADLVPYKTIIKKISLNEAIFKAMMVPLKSDPTMSSSSSSSQYSQRLENATKSLARLVPEEIQD